MKLLLLLALSAIVAVPVLADLALAHQADPILWFALAWMLAVVWLAYPAYPQRWLTWTTRGLAGLLVANIVASAAWGLVYGTPAPTLEPDVAEHKRFSGRAVPPGLSAEYVVTTDARGYRTNGPIDYDRKPAGTLRIVAIGGSTTEESNIDDRKTWTYLMGKRLAEATGRRVEVINTALSGVRAEQNYRALLEIVPLQPDLVTILIGINDWNFAIRRSSWSGLHRLAFDLKDMRLRNSLLFRAMRLVKHGVLDRLDADGPAPVVRKVVDDGANARAMRDSLARPEKRSFRPATVDPDYAHWVGLMMEECRDKDLPCVFADQPTAYTPDLAPDHRKRLWMTPPFASYTLPLGDLVRLSRLYNGWLADAAARHGVGFCPLAANLPPTSEMLYDDCHFTEAGAREVARLMTDCALDEIRQATR